MLLLSGCVSHAFAAERIADPQKPESWIGHKAIDLFEIWGSPDHSILLEGGGAILVYKKGRKVGVTELRSYDSLSRRQGVVLRNDLQFRTDRNNEIVEFQWLDDRPRVSGTGWFWGGFAVGVISTLAGIIISILAALN